MKSVFFVLFYSLLIVACGQDSQFLDKTSHVSSILKGENVSVHSELAHRVVFITQDIALSENGPQFFGVCSGVILNRRIVLTAAHCVASQDQKLKVILNPNPRASSNLEQDIYTVIRSSINSKYDSAEGKKSLSHLKKNSDLALLFVDRDFENVNESIEPNFLLKLNPFDQLLGSDDVQLVITGFGKTSSLKDTSKVPFRKLNGVLKKATISTQTAKIQKNYFALSQKGNAGVCFGDSGGPVFINESGRFSLFALAIGVFQFGKGNLNLQSKLDPSTECAGYGLYLNIHFYKKWILENMIELQKANETLIADPI